MRCDGIAITSTYGIELYLHLIAVAGYPSRAGFCRTVFFKEIS